MDFYKIPKSAITGAIRRTFSRGAIVKEVRKRALSTEVGPRGGKQQYCADCGKSFSPQNLQCDHIKTVVPLNIKTKDMDINDYILNLYCKEEWDGPTNFDNLQMLCKECHDKKTKGENQERKRLTGSKPKPKRKKKK